MANLKDHFVHNLKELRELKGLSQEKLAERVKVSMTFIAHLETGRKSPSFETLDELGKALGVPAYRLLLPPSTVDEDQIEVATAGLKDVVRKMFLVVAEKAKGDEGASRPTGKK